MARPTSLCTMSKRTDTLIPSPPRYTNNGCWDDTFHIKYLPRATFKKRYRQSFLAVPVYTVQKKLNYHNSYRKSTTLSSKLKTKRVITNIIYNLLYSNYNKFSIYKLLLPSPPAGGSKVKTVLQIQLSYQKGLLHSSM